MTRNLEHRVEVVAPVEDPDLQAELRSIIDTQLADHRSAWEMDQNGDYRQRVPASEEQSPGCQEVLIQKALERAAAGLHPQ